MDLRQIIQFTVLRQAEPVQAAMEAAEQAPVLAAMAAAAVQAEPELIMIRI